MSSLSVSHCWRGPLYLSVYMGAATRALVPGAPAPRTRATRESPLSLVLNPLHQVTSWCKPCTSLVTGAQPLTTAWCRLSPFPTSWCLVRGATSPPPATWCALAKHVFCFTRTFLLSAGGYCLTSLSHHHRPTLISKTL